MTRDIEITAHAIVSWMEFVEGYDLGWIRAQMKSLGVNTQDDGALLAYLREVTGFDQTEVESSILTPGVRLAVLAGAKSVNLSGAIVVVEDGKIVTIRTNRIRENIHRRKLRQRSIGHNNMSRAERSRFSV
jgi:hypothetical protein